jgi:hypothetical protein
MDRLTLMFAHPFVAADCDRGCPNYHTASSLQARKAGGIM